MTEGNLKPTIEGKISAGELMPLPQKETTGATTVVPATHELVQKTGAGDQKVVAEGPFATLRRLQQALAKRFGSQPSSIKPK